MVQIVGKYVHERSENLDEYFRQLGVPYIARKMMGMANPTIEITEDHDKWTLKNITLLRTQITQFTLDTEYEEIMPSGVVLKNVTSLEGDCLITVSISQDNKKVVRRYDFTAEGMIITMTLDGSDQVAKRYFKRI